jgi:hypothetical protein
VEAGGGEAGTAEGGDAGAGTGDPNDVCAFKIYRAQFDALVTVPIEGDIELSSVDPRQSSDQPELLTRLGLIDRWYTQLSANLFPYNPSEPFASSVRAAAWQRASTMEGVFWQELYRNLFPQGPVTASDGGALQLDGQAPDAAPPPTFTAAQLAALTQDTLDADRALLGILFPPTPSGSTTAPTPPMTSAPLLMMTADALEAMSQRMHSVGIYHDMGCAYEGCGPATQSELVWLMDLFAAVPDSAKLQNLLSAIATLNGSNPSSPAVRAQWLAVYSGMFSQHPAIESALQNALGATGVSGWSYATSGEPLLANAGAGAVPGPAQHLAGIIQSAQVAANTYGVTGLFNPTARNRLPAGIAQDNVDAIRQDLLSRSNALKDQQTYFDNNLNTIANSVVQEMTAKTAMTNSIDQLKQRAIDYDNTNADIAGLENSLEANGKDLGGFIASYASVTAFDDNTLLSTQSYGPWQADGTTAIAGGPIAAGADISQYAWQKAQGLAKGTIVSIQVGAGDRWAPTCALQQVQATGGLPSPTAPGTLPLNMSNALTGPEGYVVTQNNGTYSAQQNQTGDTSSSTSQASIESKICGGVHIQQGIPFSGLTGNNSYGYMDISLCAGLGHTYTWGSTSSDTTSQGGNASESINFASGFRLQTTPVPSAPVGALLVFVTDKGNPTSVRDIRVVQAPSTGIVLDADSDLYFVTNDLKASGCTADTMDKLNVSVTTAMHAGQALQWVQPGLTAISSYFVGLGSDGSSGTVVAQGRMTPDQAANIRSTALVKLVAACKATVTDPTVCDISKLPWSVSEFITSYIDRQIESLELRVSILQSVRTATGLGLQLQQMVDDYNAALAQSQVAELIPQWTLRNLDTALLENETAQLVNSATFDVYPVLQLRYPDVFAQGLAEDQVLQQELQTLVNAKWDAPVDTLATAAWQAGTELYNATATLATTYPPLSPSVVAINFVRPGVVNTQPPAFQVADGRAQQVWQQATTGNHVVTFRVLPEDLYHLAGGPATLSCTQDVPVVLDLALALGGKRLQISDESYFTNTPFFVRSFSDSQMEFATAATYDASNNLFSAGGPLQFQLKNLDWTSLDTQILVSVDPGRALLKYTSRPIPSTNPPGNPYFVNGKGLSPFNEFTVDLSSLYDPSVYALDRPVDEADDMILVFTVQTRNVAGQKTLSWIGTCH